MNRKIIACAGAINLGLAALPFAGVFAEASHTESVSVTVGLNCRMEADPSNDETVYIGKAPSGGAALNAVPGTTLNINCNSNKGWTLKATASDLVHSADAATKIPFGAYSEAGRSVWSAKVTASGGSNYTVNDKWSDFNLAKDATVISSTSATGEVTVTPQYKAYVDESQHSGLYKGTILYTFAENE